MFYIVIILILIIICILSVSVCICFPYKNWIELNWIELLLDIHELISVPKSPCRSGQSELTLHYVSTGRNEYKHNYTIKFHRILILLLLRQDYSLQVCDAM
jgi:hypothetical protein